jgi:uncharacterized protein YndB with AHSA1/START domain
MAVTAAAPVAATREVTVQAGPDVIWATLTEVDRWPSWNPDVEWVRPDGPVAPGMTFRWRSGPGTIRSTIRELEPPHRLVLVGGTLGVAESHDWRLEAGLSGTTTVRPEESWSGPVARLLRGRLQARLERRLDERLAHLRAEAERRAGAHPGPVPAGDGADRPSTG